MTEAGEFSHLLTVCCDSHVYGFSQYCQLADTIILKCTQSYTWTVQFCIVLLYCSVLCCSVQYCTILYCTVLYCNVQVETDDPVSPPLSPASKSPQTWTPPTPSSPQPTPIPSTATSRQPAAIPPNTISPKLRPTPSLPSPQITPGSRAPPIEMERVQVRDVT